jgi:hypothetical protein
VCLGDKLEKEHGDEGGKAPLPTTPTDHGKFLDTINAQLDDHLSYLCSIRAIMEPIETMLEYSPPEDIVRADVSKFIVRDELDIGIVPDVPPMTPFDETPIGIHLRDEIAQKEGELLALRELSKSDATTMVPDHSSLPMDLSILDKPQIAYSEIDLDDIWADFLQALHRPPLESKLQSLIDDNSLDIEFANLDTNIPRYTEDEEEGYDFLIAPYPLGYKNIVKLQLLTL